MAKLVLTRSFTSDDSFAAAKTGLTEDSVSTVVLDVMANDGGGKNKTLYSIDDGRNSTSDLLVQDTARTEIGSRDRSANGATIWITADGKVAYDASTISADFRAELQELSAGESMQDSFTYAVMVNGNLSWAKVTIQIAGINDAPVITSAAQVGLVQEDVRFVATGRVTATDVDGEDHDDDHHDEHRGGRDDHDDDRDGHGRDEDQDGLRFAVLGSNVGTYGSITVNAETGRWAYTLNNGAANVQALGANESRNEVFTIRVKDEQGAYADQAVTVTVRGSNDGPVITSTAQAGSVQEDVTVSATGQVKASDIDNGDHQHFSVVGAGNGSYGSLNVNAASGVWTYTLNNGAANVQALAANETHTESFTVRVADDSGAYADQTVLVTVKGTNDAPVITSAAQSAGVQEDVNLGATGQVAASDVDLGDHQQFAIVGGGAGAYGSLNVDAATGVWTYSLNNGSAAVQSLAAGETHNETFTVRVTDDQGATADQVVTVQVAGSNDGPVTTNNAAAAAGAVQEDATLAASGQLSASDVDHGATQAWSVVGSAGGAYGSIAVDAAGKWTYSLANGSAAVQSLAAGETHNESFTIRVTDDKGAAADQVVTVQVAGSNDGPVVTNNATAAAGAVQEDTTLAASGQLSASDVDHGATQAWSVVGSADGTYGSIAVDATGQWTYSLANGSVAVQSLAGGETHNESFTIRVTDDQGAVADQVVTVQVTGSNDGPVVTNTSAAATGAVQEDATLVTTGQLSAGDVDHNATQTWSVVGSADGAYGSIAVDAAGKWTYLLANGSAAVQSLAGGETHNETFTIRVTDDQGAAADQVVTVQVAGSNDGPVVTNNATAAAGAVQEDMTLAASGQLSAGDVDHNATQSWSVVGSAVGAYGSIAVDASGQWTYSLVNGSAAVQSLAAGESHDETFTIRVTDDQGAAVDQVVTVTVTGTNDAPEITSTAQAGSVSEGDDGAAMTASGQVTFSDADSGDGHTFSATAAQHGTATVDAAGHWTYTAADSGAVDALARGETLNDSFVVTVDDGHGGAASQRVNLTITGTNDAATITGAAAGTVSEDGVLQAAGQLAAHDVDNGEAHVQALSDVAGSYGTFSVDANGAWTYALNNDAAAVQALNTGESLHDVFTVVSQDGTASQDVTVTINGLNDRVAPVANDDQIEFRSGGVLTFEAGNYLGQDYNYDGASNKSTYTTHYESLSETYSQLYDPSLGYVYGDFNVTTNDGFRFTSGNAPTNGSWGPWDTGGYWGADYSSALYSQGYGNGNSIVTTPAIEMARVDGAVFSVDTVNITSYNNNYYYSGSAATFHETVKGYLGGVEVAVQSFDVPDANVTGIRNNVVDLTAPGFNSVDRVEFSLTADYTNSYYYYYNYAYQWIDNIVLGAGASNLLVNDTDTDPTAHLSVNSYDHMTTLGGTVTVTANGDTTYDSSASAAVQALAAGESAVDTFTYDIHDQYGNVSNRATASITVHGVNDVATISGHSAGSVTEDVNLQTTGQLTISDPDHGQSHAKVESFTGSYGSFSVDADGNWNYTLNNASANVQSLAQDEQVTDSFTVTSQDGTAHQQVVVTVTGTNDAPVAVADQVLPTVLTFDWGTVSQTQYYDYSTGGYIYAVTTNDGYQFTSGNGSNNYNYTSGYDANGNYYYDYKYGYGPYVNGYGGADYSNAIYSYGYDQYQYYNYNNTDVGVVHLGVAGTEMTRTDGGVFSIASANINDSTYGYAYQYNNYYGYSTNTLLGMHETVTGFLHGVQVAQQSFDASNFANGSNHVVNLTDSGFNAVDHVEFKLTADFNISSDPNFYNYNYYYYGYNYSYAYAYGTQYLDNVAINLTSSTPTDIKVLANDTDIDHGAVLSIGVYQTDSLMGAEITENANGTLHYDPTSSLLLASLNARDAVVDVFQYTTEDQYGAGSDWADVNVTVHGNVHSNVFAIHANDPVHQISGFNGAESQFGGGGDVLDIRDLLPANTHLDNSNITEYLEAVSTNGGHDTALYVDSDGAGSGASVQVATLLGVTNLFLFDLLDHHNVQYA